MVWDAATNLCSYDDAAATRVYAPHRGCIWFLWFLWVPMKEKKTQMDDDEHERCGVAMGIVLCVAKDESINLISTIRTWEIMVKYVAEA